MSFKDLDASRSLRMAILHTVPGPESFAEDLLSEVVGAIKQQVSQIEVANFDVAKLKLHGCPGCKADGSAAPCSVNDIDSKRYKPDDQFIPLLDGVKRADIVLVSLTARPTGANSEVAVLMERLFCAHERQGPAFYGKTVGVVCAAIDADGRAVAGGVANVLNGYGFYTPPYGVLAVSISKQEMMSEEDTHDEDSTSDVSSDVVNNVLSDSEVQDRITRQARGIVECAKAHGRGR